MNGVHDMGGMHGMGPIAPEKDEPVFHHAWEQRVFAMNVAAAYLGRWNIDMSRHAREQMAPAEYLATSYYEHWLWGLELLLCAFGLVEPHEIESRMRAPEPPASPPPAPADRMLRGDDVLAVLASGRGGARVDADIPPGFQPGDRVRARNINPIGHTRLPRYARGRSGVIDRDQGVWIFPDTHAAGQGTKPQHLYCVRFEARELWGPDASPRDAVYIDLFEDYLDPG